MQEHRFRCRHCKKIRLQRTDGQQYCGDAACQQARNNAWRRERYEVDPDYRANQRASTKTWLESQGGAASYYRAYRKRRKQQQRKQQRQREEQQRAQEAASAELVTKLALTSAATESANSNTKTPQNAVKAGRYRLLPCDPANRNAILVELLIIPDG
jgi:hypothetical protein